MLLHEKGRAIQAQVLNSPTAAVASLQNHIYVVWKGLSHLRKRIADVVCHFLPLCGNSGLQYSDLTTSELGFRTWWPRPY